MKQLTYQSGFGNYFSTEALPGALPQGQNSPQKPPYALYAEQLSGSAFTTARHKNLHSWLYRILPSVKHDEYIAIERKQICSAKNSQQLIPPNQLRWNPLEIPKKATDFIDGWHTFAANGTISQQIGAAIHLYACNQSMHERFFYDADGELLIVPQHGNLLFRTEFGLLDCAPGEIIVIPRGIKFQVILNEPTARGYICENFGAPFTLPERGLIGANGLANNRDFKYPVASFENKKGDFFVDCKFFDNLWRACLNHSPLNVVAWHGTLAPYKYALKDFNAINSVTFDHTDPSIFTVLTSSSDTLDVANVDFVIFPDRWVVTEHTLRPPYFHRNTMSEFMGLVYGEYDAKEEGFAPGGGSLHNCLSAHGPDAASYAKATAAKLQPEYYKDTLAFMFESRYVWQPTEFALKSPLLQKDYMKCWDGLKENFKM